MTMRGSTSELPVEQFPKGREQWPGGFMPMIYPKFATMAASLIVVQYLTLSPKLLKQISAKWTSSLLQQRKYTVMRVSLFSWLKILDYIIQENLSVYRTIHWGNNKIPCSLASHIRMTEWIYCIRGLIQPPYLSSSSCGKSWWWIVTNGSIPGLSTPCSDLWTVRTMSCWYKKFMSLVELFSIVRFHSQTSRAHRYWALKHTRIETMNLKRKQRCTMKYNEPSGYWHCHFTSKQQIVNNLIVKHYPSWVYVPVSPSWYSSWRSN